MPFDRYLKENGYTERAMECRCPHCVTVAEFIETHPEGKYILVCCDGVVMVANGVYIDANNSLDEVVIYYYEGGK